MLKRKEQAIYLAFSSALSGTYQTACLVKEQVKETYPDLDLTIYDTLSASMGCGKLILDVQDKIEQSYTFDELDTYIKNALIKLDIYLQLKI